VLTGQIRAVQRRNGLVIHVAAHVDLGTRSRDRPVVIRVKTVTWNPSSPTLCFIATSDEVCIAKDVPRCVCCRVVCCRSWWVEAICAGVSSRHGPGSNTCINREPWKRSNNSRHAEFTQYVAPVIKAGLA
jgi:hypothetical protein